MNDMLWDRAKEAAKKQYPNLDATNPRVWSVASAIYAKLGGVPSESLAKSLAIVEKVNSLAPSFIENPRIWLGAIKKSCGGSMRWGVENFQTILKHYNEAGGKIVESSMLDTSFGANIAKSIGEQFDHGDLEKGKAGSMSPAHKYADRVQKPNGKWHYVYKKNEPTVKRGAGFVTTQKKAGKLAVVPEGQKHSDDEMSKIIANLNKKDEKGQRSAMRSLTPAQVVAIHAKASGGLKKVAGEVSAAHKEKSESTEKSQDAYEDFSKSYREDIKKSLAESHPEWDAATLERRVEPQVRQMFRLNY
jgi:hypothetical protein